MSKKITTSSDYKILTKKIKQLIFEARNNIVKSVNLAMVYTYFEVGKIIIEDEQDWKERAIYNENILKEVSNQLTKEFWKGFSITNLQQMRKFYLVYWKQQTVSVKSNFQEKINFNLSWSHYIFLIRLNEKERDFYEKEAILNNWSLRELRRHFDSSLFDRILLSKNKSWVLEDNIEKYHYPEKAQDIIKDPYILEFLWLEENSNIFSKEYKLYLPSKEELLKEIKKI